MDFGSREVPRPFTATSETSGPYDDAPFSTQSSEGVPVTPLTTDASSALGHMPEAYVPRVTTEPRENPKAADSVPVALSVLAAQRADTEAAARYAARPHCSNETIYIGPDAARPELAAMPEAFSRDLALLRTATYEGESSPTAEEGALLRMADTGIDAIADLANISIAPAGSPVRFFNSKEGYDAASNKVSSFPPAEGGGIYNPKAGILWTRRDKPIEDRTGIIHERMHQRSVHSVTPTIAGRTEDGGLIVNYDIDNTIQLPRGTAMLDDSGVQGLTESTVEMGTFRIAKDEGKDVIATHTPADMLTDGVIREAARLGIPEQDMEFALYRSLFGGDPESIAMVQDVLGKERAATYFGTGDASFEQAEYVAGVLGIKGLADGIRRVRDGGDLVLFTWQPDKRT